MIHIALVGGWLLSTLVSAAVAESSPGCSDCAAARERCRTHHAQSERLYRSPFTWRPNLKKMREKFEKVYNSGKRIAYHADYNTEKESFCLYVLCPEGVKTVKLTENFIKSVTIHIKTALKKGYAHYIFLPDMGHAHLYFPKEHWQKEYASALSSENHLDELYEKMLADEQMRPLYHLSECLQMRDRDGRVSADPVLRHKYWNRNVLCRNNGTDEHEVVVVADKSRYNTVWALEGYVSWSAGFAMSASRLGCFPYRDGEGRTRYFDISLYDPSCHPDTWLLD